MAEDSGAAGASSRNGAKSGTGNGGTALTNLGKLPGIVTVLVPVLLAVAGETLGELVEFTFFALATLPWVALTVWPSWPHHRWTSAAAITAAFVAAGVGVRMWQEHPTMLRSAPAAATAPAPAMSATDTWAGLALAAQQVRFIPMNAPITYCVTFYGTGKIPPDDVLVLFDRPSDTGGNPAPGTLYSYDGRATFTAGRGWMDDGIWIGSGAPSDEGEHTLVIALLVPSSVADYLDSVPHPYTSPWPTTVLGLGAVADHIVVTRGADDTPCDRQGPASY
jgi:hypothetical protein